MKNVEDPGDLPDLVAPSPGPRDQTQVQVNVLTLHVIAAVQKYVEI